MQTHTMELGAWGVAALGPEAATVVGGADVVEAVIVGAVVYLLTHMRDFGTGFWAGFAAAQ